MHNRWWSDSATCGEQIPHYHSASKMSNNVVPLRGTLLLELPLRRLRPCGLASGYAWSSTSGACCTSPLCAVLRNLRYVLGRIAIRPVARTLRQPLHAAMSPERRDPERESRRDLAVGERSVTHGPPTLPETGVRTGRELPSFAESATAPRLMLLCCVVFPHVAGIASLAVNVRL